MKACPRITTLAVRFAFTPRIAVLTGSIISSLIAGVLLKSRDRVYRRLEEAERLDTDQDSIPDVYGHSVRHHPSSSTEE